MPSIQNIKGSDGTTETVRAIVTAQRAVSSTTIAVNSIVGFNSKFIGTTGGLDADNEMTIRPQVFFGHISGSNLIIDSFAPGYTDQGNEVGDIVVIKPTTAWADEVASTLAAAHNDNGTLKNNSVTTAAITDGSVTPAKWTNPYCFSAYHNTTQAITTTEQPISFNTEEYDYNNNFASSAYTAPVAGVYHFSAAVSWAATGSQSRVVMYLGVNGSSSKLIGDASTGSAAFGLTGSASVLLAAGDVVTIRLQPVGATTTLRAGPVNMHFSGQLVRAT